jgi:hypothetical protein
MIIESTKYKDHHKIGTLADIARGCFNHDADSWFELRDQVIDLKDQEQRDDVNWFVLHVYDQVGTNDHIHEIVKSKFAPVTEYLKNMQGVERALFNFIGPNSTIPDHVDSDDLPPYAETSIYNIVVGVFIPSEDPNLLALQIDGKVTGNKVGESIVFNGQVPHSGWNRTDGWRITMFLFVKKWAFE